MSKRRRQASTCRKRSYTTREEATRAADALRRRKPGVRLVPYECRHHKAWHLGNP